MHSKLKLPCSRFMMVQLQETGMAIFESPNPLQTGSASGKAKNADSTIKLSTQTTNGRPLLSLKNLCRQQRWPPHCMSNYSYNFSCPPIPRGAPRYEPTCQVPTRLSTVSLDTRAATLNQPEEKENFLSKRCHRKSALIEVGDENKMGI